MPKSEFLTCQRILSLMVFLGFMIHHMLRVNISIAIVEMVATNESSENRFDWNQEEKNDILGYFFWGYVLTQIPGGRLSEMFGTKIIVGFGLLIASISTIVVPMACHLGYYWILLARFCLGLVMGPHWPSTHPIATSWIPPADMSKFVSHMIASSLGVAVTLPVCGYLIAFWGWQSVFYVTGSIALVWTICWFYLIYDSPGLHPRISTNEKEKLKSEIKTVSFSVEKPATPWRKILTSGPVWAIIMGNTCGSCTFFIAFNQLPTYLSQVLHFNITQNGWFSSLPYLVRYFVALTSSILADKLIKSEKFSITTVRKFFSVTSYLGIACFFTVQALWGYDRVVSVVVFTASLGLMGWVTPGFLPNAVDVSPAYSGTIFGISQVPSALVGYSTTKIVALLTKEKQGFEQWTYVFWILVGVNLFTAIFSLTFISGEEQSWNPKANPKEIEMLERNGSDKENNK